MLDLLRTAATWSLSLAFALALLGLLWGMFNIAVLAIWGTRIPPRRPTSLTRDDVMQTLEAALMELEAGDFPESPEWSEFIRADFDDPDLAIAQYRCRGDEGREYQTDDEYSAPAIEKTLRDVLAKLRSGLTPV